LVFAQLSTFDFDSEKHLGRLVRKLPTLVGMRGYVLVPEMKTPIDVYIPDTSALVENPEALDCLLQPGNLVVLLHQVLDELGRLQASRTKSEGVRAAARAATRRILAYRNGALIHHSAERFLRGELGLDCSPTPTGGVLAWEPLKTSRPATLGTT
jgi:hypothetical protein